MQHSELQHAAPLTNYKSWGLSVSLGFIPQLFYLAFAIKMLFSGNKGGSTHHKDFIKGGGVLIMNMIFVIIAMSTWEPQSC